MRVEQGESFVVETEDAGSGLIRSADVAPGIMDLRRVEQGQPPGVAPAIMTTEGRFGPSRPGCYSSDASGSVAPPFDFAS
jgi:hypothetical protein